MDFKVTPSLSQANLELLGYKALEIIKKRTAKGESFSGDLKKYSERWFARPAGGLTKKVLKILIKLNQTDTENDTIKWFKRNNGDWFTFKGYKAFKAIVYPDEYNNGTPNLRATGSMMDGFTIISSGDGFVELGWLDPELAERYAFNELRGRSILGFTAAETAELEAFAIAKADLF